MKLLGIGILAVSLSAVSSIAACSGSTEDPAPTADNTPPPSDDGTNPTPPGAGDGGNPQVAFPAAHPAFPQVQNYGGPVFSKPVLVPVFFPGTSFKTQLVDFAGKLGPNPYWTAVASEYGIGAATTQTAIDVVDPSPATIRDQDIQAWLASRFDGTHPEFGTEPITQAIYTLYYPSTTSITLGGGGGRDGGTGGRSGGSCK